MKTIRLLLPKPHHAQRQVINESKRFNVMACGRRFGKTTLGIERLAHPLIEGFPCAWFAPTYKLLKEVEKEFVRRMKPVITSPNFSEHRFELVTGGVLDMWTMEDADAGRGRKYKRAVLDEAAMVGNLQAVWFEAIRPTLTDYQGDAWFLSTPKGLNFFHTLFLKGQDENEPSWASWQMPTISNPHIKPEEIEDARQELPSEKFAQEYEAKFLADAGGVFRRVQEAATAVMQEKGFVDEKQTRHSYVFGVDWARSYDFTVITVIDENLQSLVHVERFNQIDYVVQRNRLKTLYDKFKPHTIIAESNSIGQPNIELLQRDGLPVYAFNTTNASKAMAIESLQVAFERSDISIIKDPILIGELQAFESKRLPSGLMRYSAPEGCHDDCVMSLAMAWQGATKLSGKAETGESLW